MVVRAGGIEYGFYHSPFGESLIARSERGICHIDFVQRTRCDAVGRLSTRFPDTPLSERARETAELGHVVFSLALAPRPDIQLLGTGFQIVVWNALLEIPPGTTNTYGEVAERIGRPRSARAVAGAVAANRIAWGVPCHRVIRSDGRLGGFRWGPQLKASMLAFEKTGRPAQAASGNVIHDMA